MTARWGVSIFVVNYNNEPFLAAAIDSALGQDHPLCEVIVVDDGSTDKSRNIIARYADNVRSVLRETNEGQTIALMGAWPLARHPVLMFLDSDDVLFPYAASTVAASWTAAAVKAQFPLATIDKTGRRLGHVAPKFPPNLTTATIRSALLRTGQSPSSPGSGNAYARTLLERLDQDGGFEVDNPRDVWFDAILDCNAPFYGEVVTIYVPLACFRIHDGNDSLQNVVGPARFAQGARYCERKLDYLAQRCRRWRIPFDAAAARNRSPWLLDCHLVTTKLAAANDPSRTPVREIFYHGIKAHISDKGPKNVGVARALWFVGVALSPRPLAGWLIGLRFVVAERPRWFAWLFARLRKVSSASWPGSPGIQKDEPASPSLASRVRKNSQCGVHPSRRAPVERSSG